MTVRTAIILAGGLGARLNNTVPNLPKPMAPINNRPFLEHQMDYWIGQGINRFILSVGYLKDLIIDHFGDKYKEASIEYAIEHKPLGTGGGLLLAAKNITEPFLVLNGDTFFEVDLTKFFNFHLKHESEWTLSLFRAKQNERYLGVDITNDGKITSLQTNKSQSTCLFNGGAYLINPYVLNKLDWSQGNKVSLEDNLLPDFITFEGVVYGMESLGRFIDIGFPDDYYRASEVLSV